MPIPDRRGLLIILSSPSGAGKSTLTRRLMAWDTTLRFSVSATTRPPRPGEVEGKDYYFTTREEFMRMVAEGRMLEHAEVFGNFYGSPRDPVEAAMLEGRDTVFDVDWQGGQQIRRSALGKDVVSIFILPPTIADLESRLRGRGQDSEEVIARRMAKSRDEISHWAEYDYVIVNHELDQAENDLRTILSAERMRADRQPGLTEIVRELNREFEAR
ncbi:guanylate kinase [Paenirhodobacter populi]|uniref:Guanylate kinase n=1 Tax=Paenirhodobacter populi TaxID=2306993 RepID=A0A443JVF3_9RHOB|nr:guanylate kinase [Sinirhodobacter populi]RWR04981.1 guanylate kinase [Sinirhodobacter populi]RWR24483.1 guanylate kinase [Sinirhodobacter populi]RWR30602.1 guanylate kinase [Sinirhodobacter populi]